MVPRKPTPTNSPFPKVMFVRLVAFAETDGVQMKPSVDVTTLVPPTATNEPLPKATPDRGRVAVGLRSNQTAPSVEVRILPAFCGAVVFVYDPTATKRPAPYVTPNKLAVGKESDLVHVTPSGELAMAPVPETTSCNPTATSVPLPKATL